MHLNVLLVYLDLLGVEDISKGKVHCLQMTPNFLSALLCHETILNLTLEPWPDHPPLSLPSKNPSSKAFPHHRCWSTKMTTPDTPTPAITPNITASLETLSTWKLLLRKMTHLMLMMVYLQKSKFGLFWDCPMLSDPFGVLRWEMSQPWHMWWTSLSTILQVRNNQHSIFLHDMVK